MPEADSPGNCAVVPGCSACANVASAPGPRITFCKHLVQYWLTHSVFSFLLNRKPVFLHLPTIRELLSEQFDGEFRKRLVKDVVFRPTCCRH